MDRAVPGKRHQHDTVDAGYTTWIPFIPRYAEHHPSGNLANPVWSRKALTVTLAPRYSDHERDGALSVDVRGVARVEGPCVLVPRVSLQRVEGLRHAASVTESVV